MTKGPIVKTILKLALPIMASSFLGTLYNICDMAWVGTLGAKAVAGVGVGGMFIWLASGFAELPKIGGQVLTAQAIGAEDTDKARAYTRAAIQLIMMLGLLFGFVCLAFTRQLVAFFKLTDADSVSAAVSYTRITCGLIIFNFLNFTLTGLYTADGDSKTPMIANFIGLILNMVLDPLLITGFAFFPRLETIGAAWATVISQILVVLILLVNMRYRTTASAIFRRQNYFRLCPSDAYRDIIRVGGPISVQSIIYCFITMLLTRFISGFGAEAVAVSRVGGQIESVSWNTADGFSSAVNAFCAQNLGARQYDRIRKGYRFSVAASFAWGLLVLLAFVVFPLPISRIFFHEPVSIGISISYLIVVGLSEPFLMAEIVTIGALSGLGKTRLCSMISIIFTAMRIPLAYFGMQTSLALNGIWWAFTISTFVKGVLLTFLFFRQKLGSEARA